LVTDLEIIQQITSQGFFDDPYPLYRTLRERSGAVFLAPLNAWVLTGFDEVYTALRRHDVFSSRAASDEAEDRLVLIGDDPPRHTQLRGLVNKTFTPRRIQDLEPRIESITTGLIEGFESESVDIVDSLAVPLPVTVIAELLGIPAADRDKFKRWSDNVINSTSGGTPEYRSQTREMRDYFTTKVAACRGEATTDLFGALVGADIDGEKLSDWEIISFAALLLVAGNETTTNLIANMLNILSTKPDLWQRLREDRGLVEPVIEETLRFDSPVQILQRVTLEEFALNGALLPKGASVQVAFGAATATRRYSRSRTSSGSTVSSAGTWPSAMGFTSASGRRWRGPRRASPSMRCWTATRG
jgi:cytochrome P450